MKIFGSAAVKHWFPDFRTPNDLDIISSENYWTNAFEYLEKNNCHSQYVDPDFLLTIKVSHAAWNIHWNKTLKDISFLLNKGCSIDKEFYNLLIKDWEILHGKKNVILSGQNEDFFTNKITRKFSHDFLHEQVAFYSRPLHERIRKDLSSPECSEVMFNELDKIDQIKCMMEEISVFMFERFLFPGKTKSFKNAQYWSLNKLITSSTSGWFRLELILNFETLVKFDTNYLLPIYQQLENTK